MRSLPRVPQLLYRFVLFFVIVVGLTKPIAFALDPAKTLTQYAHRIWGQEEGLFQPTVYSILQTRDGFLWLGTQDSLIRFDGAHFREIPQVHSLHGSLIRALLEDSHGFLWVGSIGGGLTRISPDGQVKQFSSRDGVEADKVFCLAAGSNALWVCTSAGLLRISDGNHVRSYTTENGLPSDHIRTACQATDGSTWVAGLDFALYRLSSGTRFSHYTDRAIGANDRIGTLLCGSDGSVWVGKSGGLARIQKSGSRVLTSRNGLPDDEIFSLTEASDHSIWVGTNDGITRLRGDDLSTYRTRDGLSHSQVLSLFSDREGSLWAGTKDGVDQFTDGKLTPYTTTEGLSSNDVGPVLEDSAHRLWIGTLNSGLDYFDGHRFHRLTRREGLLSDSILSLALDHRGSVWVGTRAGVNRVAGGEVKASFTLRDGLSGPEVRSLFTDREGTLWAGTNRGLDRFDGRRFATHAIDGTAKNASVLALDGDVNVRVFASFDPPSLGTFYGSRSASVLLQNSSAVDSFFLDPASHTGWMATLGSGLLRWKEGVVSRVHVKDGLYDGRIYSIVNDDEGHLWFASSKGIFRVNRNELEELADGKRPTVSSLPFSTGQLRFECRAGVQPSACRTHDGRLWFSTTTGLVVVDPKRLANNRIPPPVTIASVMVNGERHEPDVTLRLKPYRTNNLEIRYAGLSFIAPEKVTFRYMLTGYDNRWIDGGDRREAFYTNLPPGDFTFRVQARNADGVWSNTVAAFPFTVEPRLYQRRWFVPVLVLLCAMTVTFAFRLRLLRLRRRFNLVLSERNRIARELHDTLLQGLSGITMQLQALSVRLPASTEKQVLSEIIRDAGRCATEARQSLWGLRQQTATSPDFSSKLRDVVRKAVGRHQLAVTFQTAPVSLVDMPDSEFQLLRIAGEATSNAIKHAGATHLFVHTRVDKGCLSLDIRDDGIGHAALSPTPGHFGLESMRERAEEIGAKLTIESSEQSGTSVCVKLALTKFAVESNPRLTGEHPIEVG